jgi:hypothetical protein
MDEAGEDLHSGEDQAPHPSRAGLTRLSGVGS